MTDTDQNSERSKGAKRPAASAEYLGVAERTLWNLAKADPDFPRPIKLSPRITVFLTSELDRYLALRAGRAA